jgi:hypothetical protein
MSFSSHSQNREQRGMRIRSKVGPGVNFTNILREAFGLIFLRQKSTNLKCKSKKAARKTSERKNCKQNDCKIDCYMKKAVFIATKARKMLVKLTFI